MQGRARNHANGFNVATLRAGRDFVTKDKFFKFCLALGTGIFVYGHSYLVILEVVFPLGGRG